MQWFWVSSLSGWLASVNTTQVNNILQEMRILAEDENTKLEVMPLDYPVKAFPRNYDMRSARVRALFIFMFSLKPLDLKTGEPLDANHIMQELDNRGFVNIFYRPAGEWAANPANRILVERKPGQSVRQRLLDIPESMLDSVLQSHGVSVEAYEALQEDDESRFIQLRAEHLARLEREFMESIGVTPPKEDRFVDADVDTDDD